MTAPLVPSKAWASLDFRELLSYIKEQTHFDAALIEQLLEFAKAAALQPKTMPEYVLNRLAEVEARLIHLEKAVQSDEPAVSRMGEAALQLRALGRSIKRCVAAAATKATVVEDLPPGDGQQLSLMESIEEAIESTKRAGAQRLNAILTSVRTELLLRKAAADSAPGACAAGASCQRCNELERLCDATYVAQGADAYNHACSEMERWQHKRVKQGKEAGCEGSLVDGIEWLYAHIEALEAKVQGNAELPTSASLPKSTDWWEKLALRHTSADWEGTTKDGYVRAVKALVFDAVESAPSNNPDREMMDWLRDNNCSLRCEPAGEESVLGLCDWIVIRHDEACPKGQEIARSSSDPREAIQSAMGELV